MCSSRRAGRWSWPPSRTRRPSGPRPSRWPCSPRSSGSTRSGSTTTSTTCPCPPTRRCSSAGPRWPPSASAPAGSCSGRWWAAPRTGTPALLAKITSNIDVMSGGRLIWGIGAGWYEHEFKGYGYEFLKPAGPHPRAARDGRDRQGDVDRARRHLRRRALPASTGAQCDPKPLQSAPPADPDRRRRRAAHAAGRRPPRRRVELRRQAPRVGGQGRGAEGPLRGRRARLRRDPEDVVTGDLHPGDRGRGRPRPGAARSGASRSSRGRQATWSAPRSRWRRRSRQYVDLGCTGFYPWCSDYPDTETVRLFAEKVVPQLRLSSLVVAEEVLAHAARLRRALALEREAHLHLAAAGDVGDVDAARRRRGAWRRPARATGSAPCRSRS